MRRDTEAQLYIYSNCPHVDRGMHREVELMKRWSERVKDVKGDREVRLTGWTRLLSKYFKSYL